MVRKPATKTHMLLARQPTLVGFRTSWLLFAKKTDMVIRHSVMRLTYITYISSKVKHLPFNRKCHKGLECKGCDLPDARTHVERARSLMAHGQSRW